MPENSQTIAVARYDASRLQAITYGALQQLGWTIKFAGENVLLAYTPKRWNRHENEITVRTEDNQLTVTSKMVHGESFDMMGRTKKDVSNFLSALETTKARATDLNEQEWTERILSLKEETIKIAEQEEKQSEEIDKVMNLSTGSRHVTYAIIAINLLVFVIMVASGVSFMAPNGIDLIKWGANYGPLTLSGDWWRLISSVFLHIGFIHIAFNMYALFMVGAYLEPMLGKEKYITAYLSTGVFASLASLWWHKEPVASAGASGAIFGMYGVFLALLSTSLIPKQVRNSLLQSIGVFVVYNLVYGMKSGVDNSAHIGGLVSGLAIGYIYYPGLKNATKKSMTMVGLVLLVTIAAATFYLQTNTTSAATRSSVKEEVEGFKHKDAGKFNEKYNEIIEMQNRAIVPLQDTTLTDDVLAEKLNNISLPEWEKASVAVQELKMFDVSEKAKQKAAIMQRYIELRKEQIRLLLLLVDQKTAEVNSKLSEVNEKIGKTVDELDQL